jgi:hypothetical protein
MATTKTDTIPKLAAKAQKVFNKYVRERDSENGYFTCISCGKTLPIQQMNAGHYIPQKNSSLLRFNEYNVHGECISDNGFNEFHLINYRKNLINKIGQEMVDWLEENQRTIKKWTRTELLDLIEKYGESK